MKTINRPSEAPQTSRRSKSQACQANDLIELSLLVAPRHATSLTAQIREAPPAATARLAAAASASLTAITGIVAATTADPAWIGRRRAPAVDGAGIARGISTTTVELKSIADFQVSLDFLCGQINRFSGSHERLKCIFQLDNSCLQSLWLSFFCHNFLSVLI